MHISIAIGCSLFVLNRRAEHSGTETIRCFFVKTWPKIHFVETACFSFSFSFHWRYFYSFLAYLGSTNVDALAKFSFTIVTTVTQASYLTESKYFIRLEGFVCLFVCCFITFFGLESVQLRLLNNLLLVRTNCHFNANCDLWGGFSNIDLTLIAFGLSLN